MNRDTRMTLGQFLCFTGIMVTLGGALAIIRTREFHEVSIFYNALMPLGLIMWTAGAWIRR
jgi:hypothetical protein